MSKKTIQRNTDNTVPGQLSFSDYKEGAIALKEAGIAPFEPVKESK